MPMSEIEELIKGKRKIVEMIDNHEFSDKIDKGLLNSLFAGEGKEPPEGSDFFG